MKGTLRFGGEGLPDGSHTFYDEVDAKGEIIRHTVHVKPGDTVEASIVKNAQSYVDRKMAALEAPAAKAAAAPKND